MPELEELQIAVAREQPADVEFHGRVEAAKLLRQRDRSEGSAALGDGAVVDHEFGTTDVLIVLPVEAIKKRYIEHFAVGRSAA